MPLMLFVAVESFDLGTLILWLKVVFGIFYVQIRAAKSMLVQVKACIYVHIPTFSASSSLYQMFYAGFIVTRLCIIIKIALLDLGGAHMHFCFNLCPVNDQEVVVETKNRALDSVVRGCVYQDNPKGVSSLINKFLLCYYFLL